MLWGLLYYDIWLFVSLKGLNLKGTSKKWYPLKTLSLKTLNLLNTETLINPLTLPAGNLLFLNKPMLVDVDFRTDEHRL